ncbi:MAG TPA: Crp/Fnr family transcriptional regulator [Thermoanaerobaculia bacterium]
MRGLSEPHPVTKNRILSALLNGAYRHLVPKLERVPLALGEVIYAADDPIRYVYFPETAVISMLAIMESGDTAEVGLIGNEGMVGIRVFLGATTEPEQAIVQVPGTAMRMDAAALREELRLGSPLQHLLLRYTQSLMRLISQSAACNVHHPIEQRLARWLLMMYDYIVSKELRLTQEHISVMMGSRRPSITAAASRLQKAGLVKYTRGHIVIRDRQGLEAAACECYWVIREEFERLHADIPRLLSADPASRNLPAQRTATPARAARIRRTATKAAGSVVRMPPSRGRRPPRPLRRDHR